MKPFEAADSEYNRYIQSPKWKAIAKKRMEIDGHRCVMCGSRGTTSNPLEVHHLSYKYIYHEESRIYQDLCTLCHADHKAVHALMNRQTDPNGRHGWKDRSDIPNVTVYALPGEGVGVKEIYEKH